MPTIEISSPGNGATIYKDSFTIANGGTTSNSVDLSNCSLAGFLSPGAWTTSTLQIEVSIDGDTWYSNVFDSSGSTTGLYSTIAASSAYAVDYQSMLSWRYVRLKAGTAQGADRVFTGIFRQL